MTQDGKALPGVAQLAKQSGKHVAMNIVRASQGLTSLPFRYVDKGSMATIGRNKAVAQIGRMSFTGVVAWWLWLLVHILFLVQFRSRIAVVFEWGWAYFTWQRRSRVIWELPKYSGSRASARDTGGLRRRVTATVLPISMLEPQSNAQVPSPNPPS